MQDFGEGLRIIVTRKLNAKSINEGGMLDFISRIIASIYSKVNMSFMSIYFERSDLPSEIHGIPC